MGGSARDGARRLDLLVRLARLATEDLELRPMLQRITDALAEEFAWELVALVSIDRAANRFVCEARTASVPTEISPGYSRPLGSGVVGIVAATGEPLLLDDTSAFPDFVETLHETRSELCVPIRHRGEVVAVLNLESPRPAAFHDDLALVEAIAGQIAGAIASARHLEHAERQATTFALLSQVARTALEADDLAETLDRIASFLRERFDFYLVAIVVADEGLREWSHRAFSTREPVQLRMPDEWPIDRGVVGRAIRSGRRQLVEDVAGDPDYFAIDSRVVAELVVPIRFGIRVLGAINVESDRRSAFPREVGDLVDLVAGQVAGAIRLALLNRSLSATSDRLAAANAELERLSLQDSLTGIANRRRFEGALDLEWRRQARSRRPLALVLLDLDAFKAYNDALGHPEGDVCLRRIGALLAAKVRRAGDLAARFGGEEFAVLLHDADLETARDLAEQLRAELEALAIPHPATGRTVSASFGVAATVPEPGGDSRLLVEAADRALYEAKRRGRNRVEPASRPGRSPTSGA